MEVYKITNKRTGQVYIGSTIYTKEHRWSNSNNGHKEYIQWGYRDSKFHKDVIDNNDLNNLVLESVEILPDNTSENELRWREDYWIKYYWDLLGKDLMYNAVRSAWTESDASQMHKSEVYEINRNNHGGKLAWNTEEALIKQIETKSVKLMYKGEIFVGVATLTEYLNKTDYPGISYSSVERTYKGMTVKKYSSLAGKITVLTDEEYLARKEEVITHHANR